MAFRQRAGSAPPGVPLTIFDSVLLADGASVGEFLCIWVLTCFSVDCIFEIPV